MTLKSGVRLEKNMSNVPLHDPDPPIKWANIPVCPDCGCDELGSILLERTFNRVISWRDGASYESKMPDESEVEEAFIEKDLGYYCCYCKTEFDEPKYVEREVI